MKNPPVILVVVLLIGVAAVVFEATRGDGTRTAFGDGAALKLCLQANASDVSSDSAGSVAARWPDNVVTLRPHSHYSLVTAKIIAKQFGTEVSQLSDGTSVTWNHKPSADEAHALAVCVDQ